MVLWMGKGPEPLGKPRVFSQKINPTNGSSSPSLQPAKEGTEGGYGLPPNIQGGGAENQVIRSRGGGRTPSPPHVQKIFRHKATETFGGTGKKNHVFVRFFFERSKPIHQKICLLLPAEENVSAPVGSGPRPRDPDPPSPLA